MVNSHVAYRRPDGAGTVLSIDNRMSKMCPSATEIPRGRRAALAPGGSRRSLYSQAPTSVSTLAQPLGCPAEAEAPSSNLAGALLERACKQALS
jgi:hypothetical protein